ncbi:transcription antitermination factor NusB [Metabacillus fastidiosus]|uniref:transcription antitermination factor NusB n=1 Tax=Metabacillus fastidiosus TaxID=1458 RepID=UPI0008254EB8|nr:transcription antitermination factor NusB [Metabacillus fastidiosus]MED4453544.1 transcription antitermination factor NusB [Metabacillus fastidiosus]MED4463806.1 transcription antitermination factor NusB [Metabacillus fastidiosus]
MKRRTAREKALQALFQIDVSDILPNEAIEHALNGKSADEFMNRIVYGTVEHKQELDELISPNLVNWTIDRLAHIDRVILRMSVYELKYENDIPAHVTLDEAIELAKIFGDDHSSKFINAVLENVNKALS